MWTREIRIGWAQLALRGLKLNNTSSIIIEIGRYGKQKLFMYKIY